MNKNNPPKPIPASALSKSLKAPTGNMIGHLETAIDTFGTDPQKTEYLLASALQEAKYISYKLSLLEMHTSLKINEGKVELNKAPCPVFDAVEQAFTHTQSLAGAKKLKLINDIEPSELSIYADLPKLSQVLNILIDNGVRHTENGYIKVSAMTNRTFLHVSVIDTGKGINESLWPTLFQASSTSSVSNLQLARLLVEAHGGDIWVSQNYDGGSIFTFTLPLAPIPIEKEAPLTQAENCKILVVDDDPINRMVLQGILKNRYELSEACDGLEAVEATLEWHPNLVLMDVMMPRMSGYDACEEIRKTYGKDRLPILFITAKRPEDEALELERSGGSAMLSKPIDKDALLSKIQQYLPSPSLT